MPLKALDQYGDMTPSRFGSVVLIVAEIRVRTAWSIFCLQTSFAVLSNRLTLLLHRLCRRGFSFDFLNLESVRTHFCFV